LVDALLGVECVFGPDLPDDSIFRKALADALPLARSFAR